MDAVLDTLVSLSTDNLPQTVDDLRGVEQSDLAERIYTCVSAAVAALRQEATETACHGEDLADQICSCEKIVAEVDCRAKQPGGWNTPAWQESKIYAHMCGLCRDFSSTQCHVSERSYSILVLWCRCAASLNARWGQDVDMCEAGVQGIAEPLDNTSERCPQEDKLQRAWYHVDHALMSGCPFSLVSPVVLVLEQFKRSNTPGEVPQSEDAWQQTDIQVVCGPIRV
jgi:hypothetical protein